MTAVPRRLLAGVVACFFLSGAHAGAAQLRGEMNSKLYGGTTP